MLYFRFDNKDDFKGTKHKSAFAGWYDICLDKFSEEFEDEYSELEGQELDTRIYEYAEELGYILDGCSCFELTEDGIEEFISYIETHPINNYEEVNIFEGIDNGYGHDGEQVAKCTKIVYTGKTEDFMDIIDNEELSLSEKIIKINKLIKE